MNKKFSLKNLNIKEVEQLSRKQLRDVLGGFTGGTGPTETDEGTTTIDSCGIFECICPEGKLGTLIACDEHSCEECEEMCDFHCSS